MGSACSGKSGQPEEAARPAEAGVVDAVNRTGVELLQAVLASGAAGTGTVLSAPVSLTLPLTVAALGSKGKTQAGILGALGAESYVAKPDEWAERVKDVASGLKSSDPRVTVLVKNAIFSAVLQPSFASSNRAADMELRQEAPKPTIINWWIKKETKDKIPQLLDESTPLAGDATVIVNAMYFKGEWKDKFDEKLTQDAEFNGAAGKTPCKMMMAKGSDGKFLYYETDTYQAASLPYGKGDQFSAVIVLPRDSDKPTISSFGGEAIPGKAAAPKASSLESVLKSLPNDWASLADPALGSSKLAWMKGALHFPRFKADFSAALKKPLEARGMTVAFTPAADFSVMVDGGAHVEEVLQRITLEVDEVGSVAAAATAVIMSRGLDMSPSFSMRCDRPFIFAIRANASNAILFAGAIRAV